MVARRMRFALLYLILVGIACIAWISLLLCSSSYQLTSSKSSPDRRRGQHACVQDEATWALDVHGPQDGDGRSQSTRKNGRRQREYSDGSERRIRLPDGGGGGGKELSTIIDQNPQSKTLTVQGSRKREAEREREREKRTEKRVQDTPKGHRSRELPRHYPTARPVEKHRDSNGTCRAEQ